MDVCPDGFTLDLADGENLTARAIWARTGPLREPHRAFGLGRASAQLTDPSETMAIGRRTKVRRVHRSPGINSFPYSEEGARVRQGGWVQGTTAPRGGLILKVKQARLMLVYTKALAGTGVYWCLISAWLSGRNKSICGKGPAANCPSQRCWCAVFT
ncbi:hypothetical protein LZ32DRAFT_434675 [Colletotrichum eremochloae]|nr:hypothetical protein LZ32DRAFT_434675 [Colletotrichum eremochloae]